MKHLSYSPALPFLCLLLAVGSLAGCSTSFSTAIQAPAPAPNTHGTGDVRGGAFGGRQPILGAHVYLYGAKNTGYTVPTGTTTPASPVAGISLLGNTVGGCNATYHLYADGSGNCYYLTGTGSDADTPANTADDPGFFNLTGLYRCNVSSTNGTPGSLPYQQVWLFSTGGDPGVGLPSTGTAPSNPAAGLTAALGTCNQSTNNFSTLPFIFMNEVSTTAFAYAVAPFAYDATHISADNTNYTTGLANAFLNASQLYDIAGGVDPGDHSGARYNTPNGFGSNPYVLINSIADILANCINSDNVGTTEASGQSTACYNLLTQYTTGTPSPTETASAAISIAKHPGYVSYNVSGYPHIFDGLNQYEPWHPAYNDVSPYTNPNNSMVTTIPAYPYDLTAAIVFSGPGINQPAGLVADPLGNVFVGNYGGNDITELSSVGGQTTSASSGSTQPTSIDIDYRGNLWSVNAANGNLVEITNSSGGRNSGLVLGTSGCAATGANCPTVAGTVHTFLTDGFLAPTAPPSNLLPMATDASGNIYIGDFNDNQIVKESVGSPTMPGQYTPSSLANYCPYGVDGLAVDQANNLWTAGAYLICKINISGTTLYTKTIGGGYGVAIDVNANGWISIPGSGSLLELGSNFASSHYNSGGGLVTPGLVAIDGNSNVFVLNGYDASYNSSDIAGAYPSLAEFTGRGVTPPAAASAVSPSTYGFQYQQFSYPAGIAIDISGNIWVSSGTSIAGDPFENTITEIIGVAAPTIAPTLNKAGSPEVKSGIEQQ